MRSIITVIDSTLTLLIPATPPDGSNPNLTVCVAELRVIRRQAMYCPVESAVTETRLWTELATALFRYLPPPTASPFSDISQLVTKSGVAVASVTKEMGK